jgi:RNA polymerase sigma-70 factor (ECF subfamily)
VTTPKRTLLREDGAPASVTSIEDARQHRQLEQLTRIHGGYLRELARKLCRTQLDPDDLVQDVLERTLRSPMPAGANERAWLGRVMHNLFIDKLRRRQARREDLSPEMIDTARDVVEQRVWWDSLTEEQVRAAVARLPADQRTTFELFAFDHRSYDEIAAQLGIAKATVGTRILRARQKLRAILTEGQLGDG